MRRGLSQTQACSLRPSAWPSQLRLQRVGPGQCCAKEQTVQGRARAVRPGRPRASGRACASDAAVGAASAQWTATDARRPALPPLQQQTSSAPAAAADVEQRHPAQALHVQAPPCQQQQQQQQGQQQQQHPHRQWDRHGRPCTWKPGEQPRLLTARIRQAHSFAELVCVCNEDSQHLNPIHITAALTVCARQQLRQEQRTQQPHWEQGPLQLEVRRLRPLPMVQQQSQRQHEQPAPEQLHAFVDWALERLLPMQHLCSARELSGTLWCLAKLQHQPSEGVMRRLLARFADVAHASSCQAMSMVLYALAVLGYQPDALWLDQLLHRMVQAGMADSGGLRQQPQPQQEQQRHERPGATAASRPAAPPQLSHQAVSNAMWALARLQRREAADVWLLPLLSLLRASSAAPSSTLQAAANALWACAALLRAPPEPRAEQQRAQPHGHRWAPGQKLLAAVRTQATQLLEATAPQLSAGQPRELCMLVYACCHLRLAPSEAWCSRFWPATEQLLGRLSSNECATLLFGVARLRLSPPPAWLAQFLSVTQPRLRTLGPGPLGSMVWACGTLRVRPSVGWMAAAMAAFVQQLPACSPVALSMVVWASSKLGYEPGGTVAAALLGATSRQLGEYSPHHLSKLLLGAAALRLPLPEALAPRLLAGFNAQLAAAGPADVVMVLRALATYRQGVPARQLQAQQPAQRVWWQALQRDLLWHRQHAGGAGGVYVAAALQHRAAADAALSSGQAASVPAFHGAERRPMHVVGPWWSAGWPSSAQQQLQPQQQGLGQGEQGQGQQQGVASSIAPSSYQLQELLRRAEQLLPAMTAQEICQCLWSAVWLGGELSPEWTHAINHVLPQCLEQLGPGDLCLLLWSLARLQGVVHVKRLLHKQLLLHSQQLLLAGRFSSRDITSFAWGYALVFGGGCAALPRAWVAALCRAATRQVHTLTGRQLGVLLRALVLMGAVVDVRLLDAASLAADLLSAKLRGPELAAISASLVQLKQMRLAAQAAASMRRQAASPAGSQPAAAAPGRQQQPLPAQQHQHQHQQQQRPSQEQRQHQRPGGGAERNNVAAASNLLSRRRAAASSRGLHAAPIPAV